MGDVVKIDDQLVLSEYTLTRVRPKAIISCIGPRGSGKSTLGNDISWHLRFRIPSCVVISGSERFNQTYKEHFPDVFVYDNFDQDILNRVFERQEDLTVNAKQYPDVFRKYNIDPSIYIIADAMLSGAIADIAATPRLPGA